MADEKEEQLLLKKRDLLLQRKAALEKQTKDNLEVGKFITETAPNAVGKGLMKAASTVGDVINIAGQKAADLLTGGNAARPLSKDDLTEPAQPWSKYFEKRGVPEGATPSDYLGMYAEPGEGHWYQPEKGGFFDPNVREVVGGALDVLGPGMVPSALRGGPKLAAAALKKAGLVQAGEKVGQLSFDPATRALEKVAEQAASQKNLNRTWGNTVGSMATMAPSYVTNPITTALRYGGGRTYSKGLRPIDEMSVRYGKPMLSPTLMKDNVFGGAENFSTHINQKSEELAEKAAELAKKADAASPAIQGSLLLPGSGGVDMHDAMQPANKWLDTMRLSNGNVDPTVKPIHNAFENLIQEMEDQGRVNYSDAVAMKRRLYKSMPESAFDLASRTPEGTGGKMAMARGIKEQVKAHPTMGKDLDDTFEEWGRYLTPKDEAQSWANKEAKKSFLREKDLTLGGIGSAVTGTATGGALPLPGMTYRAAKTPGFKTTAGWLTNKATDLPLVGGLPADMADVWTRQQLLRTLKGEEENQ